MALLDYRRSEAEVWPDAMTDVSLLPESPDIDEALGPRHRTPLLAVDGLCVALVDAGSDLRDVVGDLTSVMIDRHSPSGSLLLAPGRLQDLPLDERRDLANQGISLKRALSNDLAAEARNMLRDFWSRRVEARKRLRAFEQAL